MLISGTRHRYIYPQDTVNWLFNLTPVSTGAFDFNFHSNSGNIFNIFSLKNRKIYSYQNDFIGSYSINSNLSLSGNITNGKIDLYNNSLPLYLGLGIEKFDKITGFSLNSVGGNNINFSNLNILGDSPQYFYDQNATYRSGESIKINIVNNSNQDFTIFSGSVENSNFSINGINNLKISKNNTGYFYLVHNSSFVNFSNTDVVIDTDFGRQRLTVTLSGIRLEDETYYLSVGPNLLFVENDFYQDYNIVFKNANSANLSVELQYISGVTGDYSRPVTRNNFLRNQNVSGFIQGSGFLLGGITGLVSGFNPLKNYYEFGTGSGIARDFKVAENQYIEKNYNILASGLGDVYALTGIQASGSQNDILYSGFINFRGGILTGFFSGVVTGVVPDAKRGWYVNSSGNFVPPPISEESYNLICSSTLNNPICSQYSFEYEFKTGLKTGVITKFFNYTGNIVIPFTPSETETVNLISPTLFATGILTDYFKITGGAFATGKTVSGKLIGDYLLDFEPGKWVVSKPFSGPISGKSFLSLSDFDPVKGLTAPGVSTGYFDGIVSTGLTIAFCKPNIPEQIKIEKIPNEVFSKECFQDDSSFNYQYTGYLLQPLSGSGERFFENSTFQIRSGNYQLYEGHPTGGRTRISRLGVTPSGDGFFYHLFDIPGAKLEDSQDTYPDYNGGGWEESVKTLEPFVAFETGIVPSITNLDLECGLLYPCDPTIIHFKIDSADFYSIGQLDTKDCWSGCFANWPKKQYSVEHSGTIVFLNTASPDFSGDGFTYGLEFQICNTGDFAQKMVRLLYLNPSIEPTVRPSTGDAIFIFNNTNYFGNYYINSINYFENFRDIRLGLSCEPPKICNNSSIGTKLFAYDQVNISVSLGVNDLPETESFWIGTFEE
jgi:hypothetical protein